MSQLIVNTFLRVLLIFLPFAFLSLRKDATLGQSGAFIMDGIVIILLLGISLLLGFKWWREKRNNF